MSGIGSEYSHTQKAPLYLLLVVIAAAMLTTAWLSREAFPVPILMSVLGMLFFLLALMFKVLSISDEGEWLNVRFGPLPLFGKKINYRDITAVEAGRSALIDGLGIHYIPGRGWTYNLWGTACVKIHLGERLIQVGSDDVENLVHFLEKKIGQRESEGLNARS